jgi:hypothetical protein
MPFVSHHIRTVSSLDAPPGGSPVSSVEQGKDGGTWHDLPVVMSALLIPLVLLRSMRLGPCLSRIPSQ